MSQNEKIQLILSILYSLAYALLTFPLLLLPTPLVSLLYLLLRPLSFFSFCFDSHSSTKHYKNAKDHASEVHHIATCIRRAYLRHEQIVITKSIGQRHSSRSPSYKLGKPSTSLSRLTSILSISTDSRTARVQSGVSYGLLCQESLALGFLPLVVPEFKSITVGGAVQGIGIESSSVSCGAVDGSLVSGTLVLGNGEVKGSDQVPDLWREVPGSNGSLAVVVDVEVRLATAEGYMVLTYRKFDTVEEFIAFVEGLRSRMREEEARGEEWCWVGRERVVDAMWIRGFGVVGMIGSTMTKTQVEALGIDRYEPDAPFSPFFYQHVEHIARTRLSSKSTSWAAGGQGQAGGEYREVMTTFAYLFRWDRGGFWGITALAESIPLLSAILRRPLLTGVLNHFLSTATLYKLAMLISDRDRESVAMLQDVDVPHGRASEVVRWSEERGLKYLWLCPVKSGNTSLFSINPTPSPSSAADTTGDWVMNVGVYGVAEGLPRANLDLQRLVARCGGRTGLYAHVYVPEEEFWAWFDNGNTKGSARERYRRIREKHSGGTFLDLWEKVGGMLKGLA